MLRRPTARSACISRSADWAARCPHLAVDELRDVEFDRSGSMLVGWDEAAGVLSCGSSLLGASAEACPATPADTGASAMAPTLENSDGLQFPPSRNSDSTYPSYSSESEFPSYAGAKWHEPTFGSSVQFPRARQTR
jgi:hypothetical protein